MAWKDLTPLFCLLLMPVQVHTESNPNMDDYYGLTYVDNSKQPFIEMLGWKARIEEDEEALANLGYYYGSLAWLNKRFYALHAQGLGVLPIEDRGLIEILVSTKKVSTNVLEMRLKKYLLHEGGDRLDRLRPLLNRIRNSLKSIQASKVVCNTTSASLGDVKSIVLPYVPDEETATYVEQLMMVSDYNWSVYANNLIGVVKLPKSVEAQLLQYANPGDQCLDEDELITVMSHVMDAMPPATSTSWYKSDLNVTHQTDEWFEIADKHLNVDYIKSIELPRRRNLIKRLIN